jgi:hypothetical protein
MGGETSDGGKFPFALRRIGASGNSAAEAPHHDRSIVRGRAQARLRPESRSAAKKWRREGGPPSINPESAINSLLTTVAS